MSNDQGIAWFTETQLIDHCASLGQTIADSATAKMQTTAEGQTKCFDSLTRLAISSATGEEAP